MTTILDQIADRTRQRMADEEAVLPTEALAAQARALADEELQAGGGAFTFPFEAALRAPEFSFICEVKKASPSKGVIAEEFPYLQIAKDYEAAGASAVLLICAILTDEELAEYGALAESLGLSVLYEAHDAEEVRRALAAGARILGVNNRNLKDFSVDLGNAGRLVDLIPPDVVYVAESGVAGPEDVEAIAAMGAQAALVGEALMRSEDKVATLASFKEAAQRGGRTR